MAIEKILNKRSNDVVTDGGVETPKKPTSSQLDNGEIAVNYHKGMERLFIKNDNEEIVDFISKDEVEANYYDKDGTDTLLAGKVDKVTGKGLSTNDYTNDDKNKLSALPTNTELTTALAGKQDTINDLAAIRSGAQAGSTAYQKPSTGIPETDLSSEVKSNLVTPVVPASGQTLNAQANKYYNFTDAVNSLTITLPDVTDDTVLKNVTLFLTAGTTSDISWDSINDNPIYFASNYEIEAKKSYEIDAQWNGAAWIVTLIEIVMPLPDYLSFIPVKNSTFKWVQRATSGTLEYSLDEGQTWVALASNTSTPTVSAGNKIILRGDLSPVKNAFDGGIGTFSSTANYHAYGNVMSLLYGDEFSRQLVIPSSKAYAFRHLFYNDTHILSAPKLPATTLADYCYNGMFYGCTSLTTAPELPATTLAEGCYEEMFFDCTSLTTAPELPATTLIRYCYRYMFQYCSHLNYIKCLATDISASSCTKYWVSGVASTGTFVKAASMTSWSTGTDGIPSGWTVVDDNS